jgi:hypothetical protein
VASVAAVAAVAGVVVAQKRKANARFNKHVSLIQDLEDPVSSL